MISSEQHVLLCLLSNSLFSRHLEIDNTDWISVLNEAKAQAVTPIAFQTIRGLQLNSEIVNCWQREAYFYLANNLRVIHDHYLLHQWMTEAGILYVILKGTSSAYYYPAPSLRVMGDVDFLVPLSKIDDAGKVLENFGLHRWEMKHISHIVYSDNRKHFEMHFRVAGIPEGHAGELISSYFSDIFVKAETKKTESGSNVHPSVFHHGLILLLHTCHHMTGEGIGLRHLCDWAVFADSFSDEVFREMFEKKLKEVGLWRFAQLLTQVAVKYLGAQPKTWAGEENGIVDLLMEDIISGGNFGNKGESRRKQTLLISDRGKSGVGTVSMFRQFIHSINDIIYYKWPAAKRIKLLLIPGWLFFGGRRVFLELIGKRQI